MMKTAGAIFAVMASCLLPCVAHADAVQEWRSCIDGARSQDRAVLPGVIAACSSRIAAGADTPASLTRAYVARATAYLTLEDTARGMADFDQAMKLSPEDERLFYLVGQIQRMQGHYDGAIARLDHALALRPSYTDALLERGFTHVLRKEYDLGLADLDHAELLQPNNWRVHQNIGYAWLEQGQCDKAVASLAHALALQPDNGEAFYLVGLCKMKTGATQEAALNLEQAASLSSDTRVFAMLGRAHADLGLYDKAIDDYTAGLKVDAANASLLNDRCWTRAEWGQQLHEALADCDQALKVQPGSPNLLDSRGFVRFRMGDYAAAVADLDASLKLRPNAAPSLYVRGLARHRLGDAHGGDADIAAAMAAKPTVGEFYARFGIAP